MIADGFIHAQCAWFGSCADKRSGITNDPNRGDEPDYIVKLVGKVITVSLKTQKLIAALPPLEITTEVEARVLGRDSDEV